MNKNSKIMAKEEEKFHSHGTKKCDCLTEEQKRKRNKALSKHD